VAEFGFSPEAEAFRAEVVAWLDRLDADTLAAHADPLDLTGVDEAFERSLHLEAGERGWLDLPLELQAVFNFEAARADAPVIDTAMTLAGAAVGRFATNDHHRRVLADMAAGRVEACAAYTEPEAGTDLARLRGTAVREPGGDGWLLHATKTLLTGPHKADWCVAILRTDADPDTPPRAALSMFLVALDQPRVHVRRQPTMNGWTLGEVVLDDVRVGPEALLGTEGEGWRQMGAALAAERSGLFWLGFARHVLDLLGRHVCTPGPDGEALADDPLVLDEIGRLETAWASADLLSRRALWSQSTDTDVGVATAMAKVVTTELLTEIAQSATEIAGSSGVVWAPLFRGADIPGAAAGGRFAWEYLERIHATLGAGVNEVHRDAIAGHLLGRPSR
jgi:alkylation response protein AidB-like acyl-CoA dehydrogenase